MQNVGVGLCALATHHVETLPLKLLAPLNIAAMIVTRLVSHPLRSESNAAQEMNIWYMLVVLETFQAERSWLNAAKPWKSCLNEVTRLVSQSSIGAPREAASWAQDLVFVFRVFRIPKISKQIDLSKTYMF